ncbi:hypothetical protein [Nocardia sp. NPDC052566]|uniref:hypothetical protein n=1 Tax=Nocardia sp. NPDC052566 TaxID=3364330 RepID=UPI0037C6B49E
MTELDPSILDVLIRDHLPPDALFSRMSRDHRTPMVVALETAERELAREVAIYWVEGGAPEMFSLPGLMPAPITFSTRFLTASAQLLSLRRLHSAASDIELLAERFALQFIAELTLSHGDPVAASYLIARSLLIPSGIQLMPMTVLELENTPRNEIYMTVWFFGLLHEIGHVHAYEHGWSGAVPDDLIEESVADVLDMVADPALSRQINDRLKNSGIAHSLDTAVLREEIDADLFAVRTLILATTAVVSEEGKRDFDYVDHACVILEMFAALTMLNRCVTAAMAAGAMEDRLRADPWAGNSYLVRAQVIATYLAGSIADSGAAAEEIYDTIRRRVEKSAVNDACERGISRAMRQAMFPAERERGLMDRLISTPPDVVSGMQIQPFLDLAAALQVEDPDIEALREVCLGSEIPADRHFLALWVREPDGATAPFGLQTRHGFTIFLFETVPLFEAFYEASLPLRPGFVLERAVVIGRTAFEAAVACAAAIPPEYAGQLRVVVEGTALFDRLLRSLADDTIWPD